MAVGQSGERERTVAQWRKLTEAADLRRVDAEKAAEAARRELETARAQARATEEMARARDAEIGDARRMAERLRDKWDAHMLVCSNKSSSAHRH
jgi:uncharacterized protein YfaS (alpha-2-macroglobulin family)